MILAPHVQWVAPRLRVAPAEPIFYHRPEFVTSYANTSTGVFTIPAAMKVDGLFLLVFAWSGGSSSAAITTPAGWSTLSRKDAVVGASSIMAGRFYAADDPDPTFTNAFRLIVSAWRNVDPTTPLFSVAQGGNNATTTMAWPALTKGAPEGEPVYVLASGVRTAVAQVNPAGFTAITSTGSSGGNARQASNDAAAYTGNLPALTATVASNVQSHSYALELRGTTTGPDPETLGSTGLPLTLY